MPAARGDRLFVTREDAVERLKKSRRAGYNCVSSSKMSLSNAEGLAQRERGATGRFSGQFNHFCDNTPCCGLHSWDTIKMSTARHLADQ